MYLYSDIILWGAMYWPIQPKPNNKNPPVHNEPDFVWGSTVAPPTFNLLESVICILKAWFMIMFLIAIDILPTNCLLFPSHGAPGYIKEAYGWLGIDREMKKKRHSLSVCQDPWLRWTLSKLLNSHKWKSDLVQNPPQHTALVLYSDWECLSLTLGLWPPNEQHFRCKQTEDCPIHTWALLRTVCSPLSWDCPCPALQRECQYLYQ